MKMKWFVEWVSLRYRVNMRPFWLFGDLNEKCLFSMKKNWLENLTWKNFDEKFLKRKFCLFDFFFSFKILSRDFFSRLLSKMKFLQERFFLIREIALKQNLFWLEIKANKILRLEKNFNFFFFKSNFFSYLINSFWKKLKPKRFIQKLKKGRKKFIAFNFKKKLKQKEIGGNLFRIHQNPLFLCWLYFW